MRTTAHRERTRGPSARARTVHACRVSPAVIARALLILSSRGCYFIARALLTFIVRALLIASLSQGLESLCPRSPRGRHARPGYGLDSEIYRSERLTPRRGRRLIQSSDLWILTIFLDFKSRAGGSRRGAKSKILLVLPFLRGRGIRVAKLMRREICFSPVKVLRSRCSALSEVGFPAEKLAPKHQQPI
jgi:hypothetical protein